ncbi:uncharacterized protein LOC110901472 [Helianthus annuus]|uniref:uncharacterized protein LOC110901472 n=1 Tax=Helianthus annuus TaxID=4232 RepID=UPI001652F519|nr:uncharacterized protein LOC110901472 [Helianthus annuus]
MLKNNPDFVNLNLSSFIEKIEAHELELLKIKKMNSASVQQDVSLYYKGNTPVATNQSPKIQTGFIAENTSSASSNTPQSSKSSPFMNFEPNVKAQEQPSPQSSTGSNNQAYVSGVQGNIAVNIKNGNEITETAAKQHIALLASVLEAYEGLVAGRIVNNHQNPFTNDYYRQVIYHRPNQQPAVQRPQIENKPEKALIVNQDDEKVAEGFSWDKYIPGSDGQAMMAEVVEISEMVSEPEIVTEDVSVVAEEVFVENVVDIEEIAAEVYYYQSEQEVLASSMKSIMPPKIFESFAGYFEEPKTGSCPRFEEKKEVVEELIDVSKELTEEALKDIADKALMGKLREVDSELEKSESVSTVSVKKESDQKSGVQEIKSVKMSKSELNNVDGVEAALNLKLRSIEDDLPENIDVTFSASDTDNELQVIKTVVDQVLDEESDKSEKSQSEKVVYDSEDEDKLYSDFEYPLQNVKIENVEKVFKLVEMNINEVNNNEFFSKPKKSFVTSHPTSSGKKEGDGFEKKTAKQVFKPKEKMNDIFVAGPSVDDEKDYIFSQKAVDDFNAAKKLKEETAKSTFVEYDKRVCYRCSEIGHMAKQCKKVIVKPVFVKPSVQKQTVPKPTVQKSNVQKPRPKSPIDTKGKKPMVSPIRILKRGESLKSEDKPKSTFEVGESSKSCKTSKIYPKTKVFENQSWAAKSKPSVEVKKMENALKIESNIFKDDVVELENEIDKFLAEFPPITNKVKSIVKEEVSNVTFNFPKTVEKCDVVFGSVSEGLPKSILSKWIMDSGASRHMTGTLALLYDAKSINGSYVGFARNQGGRIVGLGTLTNGVISFDKVNYIVELENNVLKVESAPTFDEEPNDNSTEAEDITVDLDISNLESEVIVPDTVMPRTLSYHPSEQIIGDLQSGVKTRDQINRALTCFYSSIADVQKEVSLKCFISQIEPRTYKEALTEDSWVNAMQEELQQFEKLGVWRLVDLPQNQKLIKTKWVFKCKRDDRGVVVRNKARLVVQGFSQQEGIDYDEVYAPVARLEAIRIFLAFASWKDFKVYQLDVKSGFLYGKIKEEVHTKGSYDTMSDYQMNMVTALVLNKKYNFSHIVFHYMAENITTKCKTWMYPRFVQMLIDHAYPEIERNLKNDLLVQSHMSNDSLKQLARYHPNHPEPKIGAEFFGFIKDVNYVDPDPVDHQNWRNEEEMKEAAHAEELKTLVEFKNTRNDWFVKETRRRRRKVTPKVKEGEGSSSQPKKKQKKATKTLLIDEPEEDEPVVTAEEDPYNVDENLMFNVDVLETEQAIEVEAQKEKVIDDIEGDDVNKDTTSSSSSSEDEIDEAERLRRIQESTKKEKLLRKRKRQEKEDAPYVPSPQHVSDSQSPSSGRKKAGARRKVVSPKIRKVTPEISKPKIVLKKKPSKETSLHIPHDNLEDIGDFGFANDEQVKKLEKKMDEVLDENKKLAAEIKKVSDREKILEMRVKRLETDNKELLKKIDTDQSEIDILKVRVAELEEEKTRRDEQNKYFKMKNKELEAAKAFREHEFYMLNKVVESMLGKLVEQKFEEIQVEELRAKCQAEIDEQMKDKGKGVEGSSAVTERSIVPSLVVENPEPISAISGLFEEEHLLKS